MRFNWTVTPLTAASFLIAILALAISIIQAHQLSDLQVSSQNSSSQSSPVTTTTTEPKFQLSDPNFRGSLKIFDNAPDSHGHDFGYDGGVDQSFWFSHFGSEQGETRFVWSNPVDTRNLMVIKNTGNIGVGVDYPTAKLDVDGGIKLDTVETQPDCDFNQEGLLWFNQADSGLKDQLAICAKDSLDNYSWHKLY